MSITVPEAGSHVPWPAGGACNTRYEGIPGRVYLLHFDRPFLLPRLNTPARHYLGWTHDIRRRIRDHQAGRGSATTRAAYAQDVGFQVIRAWPGTLDTERELRLLGPKNLCPLCGWPDWSRGDT